MDLWFLCWLATWGSDNVTESPSGSNSGVKPSCKPIENQGKSTYDVSETSSCMEFVNGILEGRDHYGTIAAMKQLEQILEQTTVNETTSIVSGRLVAILHRAQGTFRGLKISASETEAVADGDTANSTVTVHLPKELDPSTNNTIVFCMLTWPETNGVLWGLQHVYMSRLVGLSVRGKTVSGLREGVNITMNLTVDIDESKRPSCVYFNFSSDEYEDHGCLTIWEPGWSHVTCCCDHLTYFAVVMVSPTISPKDQQILSYITLVGCSLSLFALVVTVLLFITKRHARSDISMKIHINLVIALILLNLHFLPSQLVAALSISGLCVYMALLLHYSLIACFIWTALEGVHLYLLIVRVFNIYVRRYLLKLSLLGWGIPAVIVMLVVIIDRDTYGRVPLDYSGTNSTAEICYVSSDVVKMVTTVGVFSLVFVFNLTMLGVMVRRVVVVRHKEAGQGHTGRTKRDICTLLGITCLLGITWGLVFFSFGYLTTLGLYLFCILNSLQGFFIFLWFCMSMWKTSRQYTTKTGSETRSTNT